MYIEILVLSQILNGPKHGYEIKKNVNYILVGNYEINNNVLYPLLKRYEKDGVVIKQTVEQPGRFNRIVYTATDKAYGLFLKLAGDLPENLAHDSDEFLTRVCFFYMLDRDSIEKILKRREKFLKSDIDFYNGHSTTLNGGNCLPRSVDFRETQKTKDYLELKMIEELRAKYCG